MILSTYVGKNLETLDDYNHVIILQSLHFPGFSVYKRVSIAWLLPHSPTTMGSILMPDIPYAQYIDIVKFVTQLIQKDPEEGQGIGGKRLRQLYLDQDLLDDLDYVEGEKRLIIQSIRYMTKMCSSYMIAMRRN
jgi:hypothetical protein